ncbi:hypothetical protein CPB85DRAFT_1257199 [Mucidula mucida]|nr:hypothetical protein CPB85DRAFT_1257199 [Mucidula mucida]
MQVSHSYACCTKTDMKLSPAQTSHDWTRYVQSIRVDCMSCTSANKEAIEAHIRHTHLAAFRIPAKLYRCPEPACRALCPKVSGYRSHCANWHPARCPIEGCTVKVYPVPNHPHVVEGARIRTLMTRVRAAYEKDYLTAMLQVDPEVFFATQPLDYGVNLSQILRVKHLIRVPDTNKPVNEEGFVFFHDFHDSGLTGTSAFEFVVLPTLTRHDPLSIPV